MSDECAKVISSSRVSREIARRETLRGDELGLDQNEFDNHVNDFNNPHQVTREQVGAEAEGAAAEVQDDLDSHKQDTNNPHQVTHTQAGAAPAQHDHDGRYYTKQEVDDALEVVSTDVDQFAVIKTSTDPEDLVLYASPTNIQAQVTSDFDAVASFGVNRTGPNNDRFADFLDMTYDVQFVVSGNVTSGEFFWRVISSDNDQQDTTAESFSPPPDVQEFNTRVDISHLGGAGSLTVELHARIPGLQGTGNVLVTDMQVLSNEGGMVLRRVQD